jgi:hypothetical protein
MEEILKMAIEIEGSMYQVQYVDFDQDEWTSPCLITNERIERLIPDHSIKFVRIILPNN